jgi:hypothetical protein
MPNRNLPAAPPTGAERLTTVEAQIVEALDKLNALNVKLDHMLRLEAAFRDLIEIVPKNSPSDRAGRVKRLKATLDAPPE